MKNRLKREITRKYRQRMRIYEMYILCKAYEMYHMMQLHAACAKSALDYDEAERFSDFMNTVFNADTSASTFITDPNEESDKAIEFYDKLQDILKGIEPLEQEAILSFCKNVYFGNQCIGLKIDGFLLYPIYIEALIKYVSGFGTLRNVRDSIVDFKPWYKKPKKCDSMKFRKDFIRIETLYTEILRKKEKRKGKKIVFS